MIQFFLFSMVAVVFVAIICLTRMIKIKNTNIQKYLAVALFFVYGIRLFSEDVFDNTFNLLLYDIETNIDAQTTWLMGVGQSITILSLRWITLTVLSIAIIAPFFKNRFTNYIVATMGIFVSIANIVLFDYHVTAFIGRVDYASFRSIQFMVEITLLFSISLLTVYKLIKEKTLPPLRDIGTSALIFLGSIWPLVPLAYFYNMFGNSGNIPKDLNETHILYILSPIVVMACVYFILRRKSQDTKNYYMLFLAFAAFFQYFYMRRSGLPALPLHLCNTAIILMLFAFVFKWRSFFYFAYFANVLGAILGILSPNYESDLFSLNTVHFMYNHLFALVLPLLAVALHTFEKPKLKDMYKAVIVFTIYFIVVIILNAWFNNYGQLVDYFFTYSDFLTDMYGIRYLQYDYVLIFNYQNLTFKFFWLFQLGYYLIFILLMFMSWYVYDTIYNIIDQKSNLKIKQKKKKMDMLNLRRLLDGRNPKEPVSPGGIDMIKISNFSKRYASSKIFAVKNFSLEVNKGEIFGFLGHNGAGKSTTIKSLVGIQSISEGQMEICGYNIQTQPLEAKLKMGYVSDNHAVYEKLTGREYISYVADLYQVTKEDRDTRMNRMLEKLNLAHAIDQEVKSYSHGMKQKLVVIASLIHEPPVWILDEPLTGLDPISAYELKEIMKEHAAKGNIVFFSSHVIEVVEKICTKIAIITNGELQAIYDMAEIKEKGISLETLYMAKISELKRG